VGRPGISTSVETDLSLLERTAAAAGRDSKVLRHHDVGALAAEVATTIHHELDFTREAGRGSEIRGVFENEAGVVVPCIVEHLAGPTVSVTDLLDGVSLGQQTPANNLSLPGGDWVQRRHRTG
jgi:ubiquinone biosynthesis protein